MYNPISDSESWRKQVDAYFRVMRYIAEQGYPEHALLIWNQHARHANGEEDDGQEYVILGRYHECLSRRDVPAGRP